MSGMIAFWGKMTFVVIGMIIGQLLRSRCFSDLAGVNAGVVTPVGRRLAMLSLGARYPALVIGRLTGYPDLVQSWFGI